MSAVKEFVRRRTEGTDQRGAGDVRGPSGINVNQVERTLSAILGGVLMATGLRRFSLGGAMTAIAGGELLRRGITGHCNVYQKLNLHTAGGRRLEGDRAQTDETLITRAITIGKPADELYRLWRDPQMQRRMMEDFGEVTMSDPDHAHWTVRLPMGRRIEWDTQVVEDRPSEFLRWQAPPDSEMPIEGSVQFRPAPRDWGTEVVLQVRFGPPGGLPASGPLKLLGILPKQMAYKALWRFKSLAETGDIQSIKNQPAGRNDGRDR
jgi:uncharacterized membrane protein